TGCALDRSRELSRDATLYRRRRRRYRARGRVHAGTRTARTVRTAGGGSQIVRRAQTARGRGHARRRGGSRGGPGPGPAAEAKGRMQRVGLEPEGRKYTPHVSLARLRESSNRQVADYLALRAPFRSPPFKVSRFVLFSSRASVGGGPYVVEAAYPLAA